MKNDSKQSTPRKATAEAFAVRRKSAWEPPAAAYKYYNVAQVEAKSVAALKRIPHQRRAASAPAATSMLEFATLSIAP